MFRKSILCLILGFLFCGHLYGDPVVFRNYEDSLRRLSVQMFKNVSDSQRVTINDKFSSLFQHALETQESVSYPFDSLVTVSRVIAPDRSFRIFTWYLSLGNGRFEYFGFFQSYDQQSNTSQVFALHDRGDEIEGFEYKTLGPDSWHGSIYLGLVHKKYKQDDHYVLLGWRSDNPLTRKRIIEPVRIGEDGAPIFGHEVFSYGDNRLHRVIFEHSSRASMSLSFGRHSPKPGSRAVDMIIFDRLQPTQPHFKGRYQFYVPETNIFDAFVFERGKWVFTPDIDARNPERPPPQRRNRQ